MLMGLLALILLVSVPATGGSLRRLLDLPVRAAWLLPVALFAQVMVINVFPQAPEPFPVAIHLLTYALAGVFLFANRRLPGVPLLSLGAALNGLAIAVNGGSLPASASALRRAGWTVDPGDFTNSAVLAHPHLSWLGDNFAIPAGFPFANVFSVGDVVILLGAAVIVHRGSRCDPRLTFSQVTAPSEQDRSLSARQAARESPRHRAERPRSAANRSATTALLAGNHSHERVSGVDKG